MFDVQEALEKIDQIVDAVNRLDSVTRLPEDVYRDLSIARRIIERSSTTSARTPRVNTGMPCRPSYEISKGNARSVPHNSFCRTLDLRLTFKLPIPDTRYPCWIY